MRSFTASARAYTRGEQIILLKALAAVELFARYFAERR